jgi:S1-C subfamily serine protease
VVARIPTGTVYMYPHGGIFCASNGRKSWDTAGGDVTQQPTPYQNVLRAEMKSAGFKVDGDSENVFETSASTSDVQLAAVITGMSMDYCQPMIGYGNTNVKGKATMAVTWQVYSTLQKQMLAEIKTDGSAEFKETTPGGAMALLMAGFRDNVRSLAAAPAFRQALAGVPSLPDELVKPTPTTPIALPGALQAKPRSVGEAVSAVVLILAGDTQGSGFLVSSDGLLLTDRHVVGDAKYVKIRWSDGAEGLGEVVRTDKARDVALVKTDPRGHAPLRLRRTALQPGDTVFAIGAPLDPKFQSTVTRGVVSAYRTFGGMSYIQSDASVSPGSSGGPLLDDKGEAVAATESGYRAAGVPTDINLFTPVGDALDFLSASEK